MKTIDREEREHDRRRDVEGACSRAEESAKRAEMEAAAAKVVSPAALASLARRAGWLDGNERLAGEPNTGEWWSVYPSLSLHDVRNRARGVHPEDWAWYSEVDGEGNVHSWCAGRDRAAAEWRKLKPRW